MKILIVSHEYPPVGGGGANACMFLSEEFAYAGHSVTIITSKYKSQDSIYITSSGVRILRVNCCRKHKSHSTFFEMLTFLVSAWNTSNNLLKQEHFDVCLVFFGIPSGPLAYYLKKKYELPYVIRSGGGDIPGTQKRFSLLYKLLSPALRVIWRNASAIIVNSNGLKKRAETFENRYELTVIENGVDTTFFKPCPHKIIDNNTINILFVSRLLERKGLQYIIPKLNQIQRIVFQESHKKILLTVIGDGPYRASLEKLVSENDCENLILFTGQIEKKELLSFYQDADIFILPSLWEGMPNVVLEAMSCELPIIMSPCEGSQELVTNNGIISSIDHFSSAIVDLCINEKKRSQMAIYSRINTCEKYEWNSISKKYLAVLNRITT